LTEDFWLINSNSSRVKRFSKNNQNKDKFLKNKIKASTKLISGSAVNSIVNHAKDDSIVILGVSPKNPIMKYFFGSKPLSIAQKCNCPVLITK